jgi:hypothetical protein
VGVRDRAVVDPAKIRDYLLSSEHRVGSAKARFFAQLGFERLNWIVLQDALARFAPVVLLWDLPEAELRSGDLGAVVQVYGADAVEVEFVTASGRTQALLTLPVGDVRPVRDDDLLAVRTAPQARGAA